MGILEINRWHPVNAKPCSNSSQMGIQAFQPVLIEKKRLDFTPLAIVQHSMLIFDGESDGVPFTLVIDAVLRSLYMMLVLTNYESASGGPICGFHLRHMILGLYYLTNRGGQKGEGKTFFIPDEVIISFRQVVFDIHSKINVRITAFKSASEPSNRVVKTSTGRGFFNAIVT